jgi:hypothetical protein
VNADTTVAVAAWIVTGSVITILGLGVPSLLIFSQMLRQGVIKGSGNFMIVPPGKRWDTGRTTPNSAPAGAASSGEGTTATPAGAVPKTMRKVS